MPKRRDGYVCRADRSPIYGGGGILMAKRFAIVIGVAAAGVMALGAQSAAAVVKYETQTTITQPWSPPHMSLLVSVLSEARKCELGRRVVLFRQRPGADGRIGTGRTTEPWRGSGAWIFHFHRAQVGWHVYAQVRRKVRDQFVCRPDRSRTDTVE